MTDERMDCWCSNANCMDCLLVASETEVRRLKALVKAREWVGSCCYDDFCPWCGGVATYRQQEIGHTADCPAFTPTGEVR